MARPKIVDISKESYHRRELIGAKVRRINKIDFTGDSELDFDGFIYADVELYSNKKKNIYSTNYIFYGVKFDYLPEKWKNKLEELKKNYEYFD